VAAVNITVDNAYYLAPFTTLCITNSLLSRWLTGAPPSQCLLCHECEF